MLIRRDLFGVLAGVGTWMGMRPALAALPIDEASLADRLLKAVRGRQSAAVVGEAYLYELGQRPRLRGMMDQVMSDLDLSSDGLHQIEVSELRDRFKARTSDDFAAGRTIRVNGWVLGETEVRLCGVAALAA